jgi:hypothetical protein
MFSKDINTSRKIVLSFTKKKKVLRVLRKRHSGKEIQLSAEDMYLGLMLDKGMSWATQLDEFMYRA